MIGEKLQNNDQIIVDHIPTAMGSQSWQMQQI